MTDSSMLFEPAPQAWNPRQLEGRASLALKILAGLDIAAIALALLPSAAPAASLSTAAWLLAVGGVTVMYVLEARGIDHRRPWALAAMRPLLVVLAVAGTYATVDGFMHGQLRPPFELSRPEVRPLPRPDPRAAAVIVVAVASAATISFGPLMFGWGGVLDVHEPDLRASLTVDCGTPGAGPPATVNVTYDWSWARWSPFPSGLDVVVIAWAGKASDGRVLYLLGDAPDPGAGIHDGLQRAPSDVLAEKVEDASEGSWHWGVQLAEQQLRPSRIEVPLELARANPPGPSPLIITASYVHAGLWRSAANRTCTW
jgi:hypothetical protein